MLLLKYNEFEVKILHIGVLPMKVHAQFFKIFVVTVISLCVRCVQCSICVFWCKMDQKLYVQFYLCTLYEHKRSTHNDFACFKFL